MEERSRTDYWLAKEFSLSHSTVTNMFNRDNAPTLPTVAKRKYKTIKRSLKDGKNIVVDFM